MVVVVVGASVVVVPTVVAVVDGFDVELLIDEDDPTVDAVVDGAVVDGVVVEGDVVGVVGGPVEAVVEGREVVGSAVVFGSQTCSRPTSLAVRA